MALEGWQGIQPNQVAFTPDGTKAYISVQLAVSREVIDSYNNR